MELPILPIDLTAVMVKLVPRVGISLHGIVAREFDGRFAELKHFKVRGGSIGVCKES